MNIEARQILVDLIGQHGRGLAQDPRRCEALLKDASRNQYCREVTCLVVAVKHAIPDALLDASEGVPIESLISRCSRHLHEEAGLDERFARWSVESWAVAFGIMKDEVLRIFNVRKASEQGDAASQFILGVMYENGRGVAKDGKMAAEWYLKAADQGNANAQCNLGRMYAKVSGMDKDDRAALEWFRKAANQGNAQGQCNLGRMYASGRGVAKNDTEAVRWYLKAANQGNVSAQFSLGMMYDNGRGVANDEAEAVKWYGKAADNGYMDAQFLLGWIYENGRGVAKDEVDAVKWYRKAADQGHAQAQVNLREMTAKLSEERGKVLKGKLKKTKAPAAFRGNPGEVISINLGDGMKMELVWIPSGEFMMGSPANEGGDAERPQHKVAIKKGFCLGKNEVTQEQWEKVMGSNPSDFKGPMNPVDRVSWDDCQEFLQKLNAKALSSTKLGVPWPGGFRLPTEAEWEHACGDGTKTVCYTGNEESDLERAGWYAGNSGHQSHPVGQKEANAWGLYDMLGNVWEWCQDWCYDSCCGAPDDGRKWENPGGEYRVLRGGSWLNHATDSRVATRIRDRPSRRCNAYGFRVVFE